MVTTMDYAVFVYTEADNNVMATALHTLRVSGYDGAVVIIYDKLHDELIAEWKWFYSPIHFVKTKEMKFRCFDKIGVIRDFVVTSVENNSKIGVFDADLYFKHNPSDAFEDGFDLLMTGRKDENFPFPINSGVYFLTKTEETCRFLQWYRAEAFSCESWQYRQWEEVFKHRNKCGLRWWVDQDLLCLLHLHSELLPALRRKTLGWEWNCCPRTSKPEAELFMINQFHNPDVKILHLKGRLKRMIYNGELLGCVIKYERVDIDWSRR